jgi:sugar lactone lactonase YvrE
MIRQIRGSFVLAAVVMVTAAVALATRVTHAADGAYRVVENWGPLSGMDWGEVTGVAMGAKGQIYALRRGEPPIVELDPSGKVLKTWGEHMFVWPHGFRVDRNGFIWITDGRAADGRGQQVFKLTADGRVVLTLGTKGVSGDGPNTFNGPCDVAVAENGDIFVADGHVNARVVKFSKDGTFIKSWGRKGDGPGDFNVPHAIAIDSRGRVFVADRGNKRIQIFDQDGRVLDQWTQFGRPSGILIMPDDEMYVADPIDRKAILFGSARDGTVHGTIEGSLPESVAVGADAAVYAGETTTGHTLRKLVKQQD